jgi:hypothetical protein
MKKMFQFRVSESKCELENTHIQQDVEGELKTLKDLYDKSFIPEKVYLEKVSSLI